MYVGMSNTKKARLSTACAAKQVPKFVLQREYNFHVFTNRFICISFMETGTSRCYYLSGFFILLIYFMHFNVDVQMRDVIKTNI